jgi:anti-anti-sigma factor
MTRAIGDLSLADHSCVIPDSDEHLWEVTAAWVADGLAAGDRVVYFEDDSADRMLRRLFEDRVGVHDALDGGQLLIVPTEITRKTLTQPAEAITQVIAEQIDETHAQGWPGLRLAGESQSGLRAGGLQKIVDFERSVDRLLHTSPTTRMLCRYDRRYFDDHAVAAMRDIHETELVTPAVYDDTLLRITHIGPASARLAGEVDHSNRLQIRRLLESTLDAALRSHSAPTDITLDLSSLRFLDVAGAVGLVHAAEEFPSTHRLVLAGVQPRVMRVLDRCGAPFAAQLVVTPLPAVEQPGAVS